MDVRQELRSLKRGLEALSLINQVEAIGTSELARCLGLPRTTAERILATLAAEGYVHRMDADKRYRLSLKVCALARGFSDESWVAHFASPLLFDFTKYHGWPLSISTPSGLNMSVRLTTESATSLWLTRKRVGSQVPMLGSGPGLVYLAFAKEAERTNLLNMAQSSGQKAVWSEHPDLDVAFQRAQRDNYVFQAEPGGREDTVNFPIITRGRIRAVLTMTFMTRGLRRADVIANFVDRLQELADRIGSLGDEAQSHERSAPPVHQRVATRSTGMLQTSAA